MAKARKVAIVTGAGTRHRQGGGAGAAAQTAMRVALAGRRQEPLEETAREAGAAGAQALAVPTDVGRSGRRRRRCSPRVKQTFGRLDLLFNNAGIGAPAIPIEDLPFEQWKAVVDTNLTGMFLCTQEAFRS